MNAGIHILSTELLYSILKPEKHNLDNEILKPLVKTSNLLAYDTPEYIKDMGTPERYYQVVADINSGVMQNKNLSLKQRAAFIDRDGTINKYVGFLKNINDFELLPNVSNAIKLLNKLGYLVIVVTNQPVIARGDVTESELKTIHNKMETLLGNDGAYVDAIYYCPHHPDSGYPGEIKELKIKCHCRKPDTWLIEQAQRDFNIDINNSFIIGDSSNDMQLANNLNIPFYKVDYENDLLQCVERRIEDEKSRIIRWFNKKIPKFRSM